MAELTRRILFLPGDGTGPEVIDQVRRVRQARAAAGILFAVEEDLVGGSAYDEHGVPLATRRWPRRSRSAR